MALAKVGNPVRGEPLRTSQAPCRFRDEEAELLTHCFLKCFRSLEPHQLHHHSELSKNELFAAAAAIFDDNTALLEQGAAIARHLHSKSQHPNIKSGDLCVALVGGVGLLGTEVQALSIVKSESRVPFLQISERDGDLVLTTEEGIYPEKIDKGCLILDHGRADGFTVYLFDKGGGDTRFWVRDFIGARPATDEESVTRRFTELCVEFAKRGLPEETVAEERMAVASRAVDYLREADEFDLGDFEEKALVTPERIEQFGAFKAGYEEERGAPLEESFAVSKKEAEKAAGRLKSRMKLDVGVELKFSAGFIRQAPLFLERGRDDDKGMEFLKIYFHKEEAG
jgi:hypothetical protein